MKRLMSLWGKGARAEDDTEETDEEKESRERAWKEEADRKAEEEREEKKAAAADDEKDDDDEDKEAAAAAAALPARVRASIVRAERTRIHAIVDGGGEASVATSLQLALGTDLDVKTALAIVLGTASASGKSGLANGRLGLRGDMATRRQPQLGAADGPADGRTEIEKTASFILGAGRSG